MQDYLEVRTERPVSGFGGLLSLPWFSLHRFAVLNGYIGSEVDWFIRIVRKVDGAVIKEASEKLKTKKK